MRTTEELRKRCHCQVCKKQRMVTKIAGKGDYWLCPPPCNAIGVIYLMPDRTKVLIPEIRQNKLVRLRAQ